MPEELLLDLEAESLRAEAQWRAAGEYLSLAVAAALTFHQARRSAKAMCSRADYDDALDIAASALSRLMPVYTLSDPAKGRERIPVNLLTHRFDRGATRLRASDGSAVAELSVLRSGVPLAVQEIKRIGLPFM